MTDRPWFDGFDSHRLTLPHSEVHFRVGGPPDAPALLLLHGFPQTHAMWHRVAQALRGKYRLVLPDLRGYGESRALQPDSTNHEAHSKRAMAADLAALLGHLGIEAAHVCGHDRGGRVAHRLALDHPQ
jgi:haloacetate dehalogenase